jgi:putative membrane-bound dehydrogenase-like protein
MRWSFIALTVFTSTLALALDGPLQPEQALRAFDLEPDLVVELVAAEPLVVAPCAIAWDAHGRMFVAENRGYPLGGPKGQAMGRIALLEDTNKDGLPDKRRDFAIDLTYPNGMLPWRDGLIVTCAPDVFYFKDKDGDGVSDSREVLLTGFATNQSTQLRVNKPMLARDGWVYLASGLSGGRIGSPRQPESAPHELKGDLRFNPDTLGFEGIDGKSQFGQDFDESGHRFGVFNRVQVRHFVLPSSYLARNPRLPNSGVIQDCPDLLDNPLMRGGGGAARLYPLSANVTTADSHKGTFTAACAIHLWRGGALPERYLGHAFSCDPTANLVHHDILEQSGATFYAHPTGTTNEFLRTADSWFRPVYLATGPDGALYICDMYRKSIEHPEYLPEEVRKRTDFESGRNMGRIWRVRAKNKKPAATASFASGNSKTLLRELSAANSWRRDTAFRLLSERLSGTETRILEAALKPTAPVETQVALLNLLNRQGKLSESALMTASRQKNAALREWTLRLAEPRLSNSKLLQEVVSRLTADVDPRIRFQSALAIGSSPASNSAALLATVVCKQPDDRWTRLAVLSSSAGRELELLREVCRIATPSAPTALFSDLGKAVPDGSFEEVLLLSEPLPFRQRAALLSGLKTQPKQLNAPAKIRLEEIYQQASQIAGDQHAILEERILATSLLGLKRDESSIKTLLDLTAPSNSAQLQIASIRALSSVLDNNGVKSLVTAERWKAYSPATKETILSGLFSEPARAAAILDLIESEKLPASALLGARRNQLLKSKDEAIRARAEKILQSAGPADRMKAYEESKKVLSLKARPTHGREVFKAICSNCHRLDGDGYAVGPDLFDIRHQPKEAILLHVIVPEYEVAPNFTTYAVETTDGRSVSGLLAGESVANVTLRQALGVEETIPRNQIKYIGASSLSLMPQELERTMSPQDLADVIAYVKGE